MIFYQNRYDILWQASSKIKKNGAQEGLTTVKYELKTIVKEYLFTKIIVTYNQTDILKDRIRYYSPYDIPIRIFAFVIGCILCACIYNYLKSSLAFRDLKIKYQLLKG